ncbi:hypothetical protein [Euzebya tangerina]|uniref:hypothetical protein n=1 Tax=Euzebya tangerina TaxID=591198 RepID=UPI000E317918|nr:hypothetical protein [Euzebya tangerina]
MDQDAPDRTSFGQAFGREIIIIALATILSGAAAAFLAPPPEDVSVATAVLRTPTDISSSSGIGLYVTNFGLSIRSAETADIVAGAVPDVTPLEFQTGVTVERQGSSVLFDVTYETDDELVAAQALDAGIRATIDNLGTAPLEGPTDRVERARAELEAAQAEIDRFIATTGVFDPRGTYQGTLSDIRSLDRQIREATLLSFGSIYIAGLETAKANAEAELPRLIELAREFSQIEARIGESQSDLFAAEDALAQVQATFELQRSPEALILQPVDAATGPDLLPWLQRVILAAATGFGVSFLAVLALWGLGRGPRSPDGDPAQPDDPQMSPDGLAAEDAIRSDEPARSLQRDALVLDDGPVEDDDVRLRLSGRRR